jgi:tRNA pseudouridine55 synthase
MNGVLVVDKPAGPTSHDVVARVRRLIGIRRIGHTGTLDPLATGVLPLVVGRATRLASLLSGADKEYVASVRFGAVTDTYDADPWVTADAPTGTSFMRSPPPYEPPGVSEAAIAAVLPEFLGEGWQVPPPFSAKKVEGVRAYTRARRQEQVAMRPVRVTVHRAHLEAYAGGLARIRLVCSAGFYVRSFAHDLGQRLGCGAYLEGLRRTRAGDFTLEQAVSLSSLEGEGTLAAARLIPMPQLLPAIPAVVLNERGARRASHGNSLGADDVTEGVLPLSEPLPDGAPGSRIKLLDGTGALIGIGEVRAGGILHPVVVLV